MRPELHIQASDSGACADRNTKSADGRIAALAGNQRGVVSHAQLLAAGVDRDVIKRRVRSGRLHPVHRGVYLVGHAAPVPAARELAAVLACGTAAVVSHRSAAHLWKLLPYPANPGPVHITVAGRHPGRRPGIEVHRVTELDGRDVRALDRIPVTAPARTLLDVAAAFHTSDFDRALAEAQVRRLVRRRDLEDQVMRNRGRTGVGVLRRALDAGPAPTRSEAERRMLALIRSADLPVPRVNARVGRYEVDFLWPEHRLVVEVDGYAFHSHRGAFERDRERDAGLAAAGYTVVRVTWRQLVERPERVVARLAAALSRRA